MAEDTIFHKIIRREIPAEILHEDEQCIAIKDINPVSPVHLLVIPKKSLRNLTQATANDDSVLGHLLLVANQLAHEHGIAASGYRVVINNGEHACQTVHQLHIHVLGGRDFTWPPG